LAGIEYYRAPVGPDINKEFMRRDEECYGPVPGWYAVNVAMLRDFGREYAYFLRFKPVAMAGYSIYIYHISVDEANRVRKELGLDLVGGDKGTTP
jgi:hypothetical protein